MRQSFRCARDLSNWKLSARANYVGKKGSRENRTMFSLHSRRNAKRRKERKICRARAHTMITEKAMSCAMYTGRIYFHPWWHRRCCVNHRLCSTVAVVRQCNNKVIYRFDVSIVRTGWLIIDIFFLYQTAIESVVGVYLEVVRANLQLTDFQFNHFMSNEIQ